MKNTVPANSELIQQALEKVWENVMLEAEESRVAWMAVRKNRRENFSFCFANITPLQTRTIYQEE